MKITLPEIPVMYLETREVPEGVSRTFDDLESRLKSLRGRKFYGAYYLQEGVYQACVVIKEGDDPGFLGLSRGVIPGGLYVRGKVLDWSRDVRMIPAKFDELADVYEGRVDKSRPSVEFYRSQREVICLLPIKEV